MVLKEELFNLGLPWLPTSGVFICFYAFGRWPSQRAVGEDMFALSEFLGFLLLVNPSWSIHSLLIGSWRAIPRSQRREALYHATLDAGEHAQQRTSACERVDQVGENSKVDSLLYINFEMLWVFFLRAALVCELWAFWHFVGSINWLRFFGSLSKFQVCFADFDEGHIFLRLMFFIVSHLVQRP